MNLATRNLRQIWSEQACRFIAADLRDLADRIEKRADEIKDYRGNIRPIEDKAPALKAAIRVLTASHSGLDPASECRRICNAKYLKYEDVWRLFIQKRAQYDRAERDKRNRAIRKMKARNMKSCQIAAHFGLSTGQVSKILNA